MYGYLKPADLSGWIREVCKFQIPKMYTLYKLNEFSAPMHVRTVTTTIPQPYPVRPFAGKSVSLACQHVLTWVQRTLIFGPLYNGLDFYYSQPMFAGD